MLRTRVKICGIRDVGSAMVAAEAGADAVGLVFVDRSPRCATLEQAAKVARALPAFVQPVGLFMDASAELIRQTAAALGLHTIQLHGSESPAFAAELAPLRVIKALAFDARHASEALKAWRSTCPNLAGILFDAPPPPSSPGTAEAGGSGDANSRDLPGGTGRQLDWSELGKLVHSGLLAGLPPHVLAGGLTAQNVGQAMRIVRPYAVDVSSGVESSRGVKDADQIRAFVRAVRDADARIRTGG